MTLLLNTFPKTQRYLSISLKYYCQLKYHTAIIMIEVVNAHELPLLIRQNIAMYKIKSDILYPIPAGDGHDEKKHFSKW